MIGTSAPEDPEAGEQQPLLTRRQSVRHHERQQFQQSQRQVVVNVANDGQGFLARLMMFVFYLICIALVAVWFYLYFGTIYIIIFHLDKECDQPLGGWLVVWMILPTVHALFDPQPPAEEEYQNERNRHSMRSGFIHSVWFGFGMSWFHMAKTCQKTNAPLYEWVKFVIHIYVIGLFFILVFPLMLAFCYVQAFRFYHWLIDAGWISNPKAASADTIDNMEEVTYDPSLFGSEDNALDTRPSGECCCCQENFGPELPIVKTACGHYYHKQCLAEWLKLAKSCPLCRCNLDAVDKQEEKSENLVYVEGNPTAGDEELAQRLQAEELQAATGL